MSKWSSRNVYIYEYRHNACNDQQFCGLKTCSRCRGSVVACPALLYSLSLLYLREEEEPRDIFGSALPKWSADPLWCTCYTMVSPPPACCCISPNVARGAAHAALHMDRGCNTTSPTKTDTKKSMAQFRGQVGGGGGDDC